MSSKETVASGQDRLDRLAAEAEVEIEIERDYSSWNREAEPKLYGTFTGEREVDTKFGTRRVVTIERTDGTEVDVWLTPFKLNEEWELTAPAIGDFLLISFHGNVDTGKGNPMADIRVRVDRDQSELGDDAPIF